MPDTNQLEQLREVRDELKLAAEVAALESEIKSYGDADRHKAVMEASQILGSSYRYTWGEPGYGSIDTFDEYPQSVIHDRLHGEDRPIFATESELSDIRGIARFMASVDEGGIGILEGLTNYEVGTGFEYDVVAEDDTHAPIAKWCKKWLDEFRKRVKWRSAEREVYQRRRRDGEPFIQLVPTGGGRVRPKLVEPTVITEPDNTRELDEHLGHFDLDWSFGIATVPDDHTQVVAYFANWDGNQNWDLLMPHEVCHDKLNVDSGVKRGISDYYAAYENLRRAAKVERNVGEGGAIQAAIALIKKYGEGTSVSQAGSLVTDATAGRTLPTAPDERTLKVERFPSGSVYNAKGLDVMYGPLGQPHGPALMEIAKSLLTYAGIRWNFPTYMVTGDISDGSFATSLMAESPFVKARESGQVSFGDFTTDLMWKVLDFAVRAGKLREFGITKMVELKMLVDIEPKPPRVSVRNRLEDTQVNQVLSQAGIISKKTWAQQEDLDYENEQQLIAEQPQPAQPPQPTGQPPAGAGSLPFAPPPAAPGAPNQQAEGLESRFAQASSILYGVDAAAEHIEQNWQHMEGKRFSLMEHEDK
jgi:hypothetical protein